MKKHITISIITVVILILCGCFMVNLFSFKVNISGTNAKLTYIYNAENNAENKNVTLSAEESEIIKNIFNGQKTHFDNPSCGFTKNISIKFNSQVFCIACDNCPIIKLRGKYFSISETDRETINRIFEKYGGLFPCP